MLVFESPKCCTVALMQFLLRSPLLHRDTTRPFLLTFTPQTKMMLLCSAHLHVDWANIGSITQRRLRCCYFFKNTLESSISIMEDQLPRTEWQYILEANTKFINCGKVIGLACTVPGVPQTHIVLNSLTNQLHGTSMEAKPLEDLSVNRIATALRPTAALPGCRNRHS